MKLERLHEHVLPTVVILAGVGFAAYCGHLSGSGQTSTLAIVVASVIVLTAFLILRTSIWMLIPMTFLLNGQMPILPLPFGIRDLIVFTVFIGFLVLKALKVVKLKPKLEAVDWWMFAMLLYLVTVYIRNPVGVDALGSERVGGRPYFNVFLGCLAYWVLSRALLAPRQALLLIGLICAGRMSEGLLSFITFHFPDTVPVINEFYSGIEKQTYDSQDIRIGANDEGTQRQVYLVLIGNPLILALWSLFRPLTVLNPLYILRFLVFLFGLWCVFASGFRSSLALCIAMMYFAAYLRRGVQEVVRLSMLGLPVAMVLIAGQGTLYDLPLSAQRALSFLPGRWDPVAIADAQGSTEWRMDMWRATLSGDKYIHDKMLGDGFGFNLTDLTAMASYRGNADSEQLAEDQLIVGGIHSGPISAIRYVGFVGLAIFVGLLIVVARTAWRLIRRAEGTEYYPLALFLGLPLLWEPFNYIFIFGAYESGLPPLLCSIGMLKMLTHSLDAYATQAAVKSAEPPAPQPGPVWQRPPLPAGAHLSIR